MSSHCTAQSTPACSQAVTDIKAVMLDGNYRIVHVYVLTVTVNNTINTECGGLLSNCSIEAQVEIQNEIAADQQVAARA